MFSPITQGFDYLRGVLANPIAAIQRTAEAEERALEGSHWEKNLSGKVTEIAQSIFDTILSSASSVPNGVRRTLIDIYDLLGRRLPDMAATAPQVLLFLRFVNPAIITPERFLIGKRHTPGGTKLATAVAKVIQVRLLMRCFFLFPFVVNVSF